MLIQPHRLLETIRKGYKTLEAAGYGQLYVFAAYSAEAVPVIAVLELLLQQLHADVALSLVPIQSLTQLMAEFSSTRQKLGAMHFSILVECGATEPLSHYLQLQNEETVLVIDSARPVGLVNIISESVIVLDDRTAEFAAKKLFDGWSPLDAASQMDAQEGDAPNDDEEKAMATLTLDFEESSAPTSEGLTELEDSLPDADIASQEIRANREHEREERHANAKRNQKAEDDARAAVARLLHKAQGSSKAVDEEALSSFLGEPDYAAWANMLANDLLPHKARRTYMRAAFSATPSALLLYRAFRAVEAPRDAQLVALWAAAVSLSAQLEQGFIGAVDHDLLYQRHLAPFVDGLQPRDSSYGLRTNQHELRLPCYRSTALYTAFVSSHYVSARLSLWGVGGEDRGYFGFPGGPARAVIDPVQQLLSQVGVRDTSQRLHWTSLSPEEQTSFVNGMLGRSKNMRIPSSQLATLLRRLGHFHVQQMVVGTPGRDVLAALDVALAVLAVLGVPSQEEAADRAEELRTHEERPEQQQRRRELSGLRFEAALRLLQVPAYESDRRGGVAFVTSINAGGMLPSARPGNITAGLKLAVTYTNWVVQTGNILMRRAREIEVGRTLGVFRCYYVAQPELLVPARESQGVLDLRDWGLAPAVGSYINECFAQRNGPHCRGETQSRHKGDKQKANMKPFVLAINDDSCDSVHVYGFVPRRDAVSAISIVGRRDPVEAGAVNHFPHRFRLAARQLQLATEVSFTNHSSYLRVPQLEFDTFLSHLMDLCIAESVNRREQNQESSDEDLDVLLPKGAPEVEISVEDESDLDSSYLDEDDDLGDEDDEPSAFEMFAAPAAGAAREPEPHEVSDADTLGVEDTYSEDDGSIGSSDLDGFLVESED